MTFSSYLEKAKYSGTAAQKDPSQPSFKAELGELTEKTPSGELLDQLAAEQLTEQAETSRAAEQEARIYIDPRPDLEADSALWTKLLRRAQKIDPMLAGTLHGFRCGGLRIKRGRTGYLLLSNFPLSSFQLRIVLVSSTLVTTSAIAPASFHLFSASSCSFVGLAPGRFTSSSNLLPLIQPVMSGLPALPHLPPWVFSA